MPTNQDLKIQSKDLQQLTQTPLEISKEPRFKTQVVQKVFPDDFTMVILLKKPSEFTFKAGQYVWLVLPERSKIHGLIDRRAYSISSPPKAENLELLIRITPSDYLKSVKKLKIGAEVEIIGPMGHAFVPPDRGVIMVSGGVGIAPFLSILRSAGLVNNDLYAFESKDRPLSCKKELLGLNASSVLVNVIQDTPSKKYFAKLLKAKEERPIFISGPEGFVTSAANILMQCGINPKRFSFEAFYPKIQSDEEILEIFDHIDDSGQVVPPASTGGQNYKGGADLQEVIRKSEVVQKVFTPVFLVAIILLNVVLCFEYFKLTRQFPWFPFVMVIIFSLIGSIFRKILHKDSIGRLILMVCLGALIVSRMLPVVDQLIKPWLIIFPLLARKFLKPKEALWLSGIFIAVFITTAILGNAGIWSFQFFGDSVPQYVLCLGFITVITQVFSRREEMYEESLHNQIADRDKILFEVTQFLKLSEMFIQISTQTSNHVVLTDRNGRVLYANKGAERLTGYTFKEMRWQTPRLWGGLMASTYYEDMWGKRIQGEIMTREIINRRRDGSLYVAWGRVTPIFRDSQVVAYVATEEDVTRLKEIDKAKTEFVSLASHQLRTPLSAINWYGEMLIAGDAGKLSEEQEKYVKEIYTGSQRMVDLVNALLNVSRLDLGTFLIEPERVNIREIAQSVIKDLGPLISQKHITLAQQFDAQMPVFSADAKLLRMILQNLLSNAVKYSQDKGEVIAEIKVVKKNEKFGNKKFGFNSLCISVRDKGMGIPLQQQNKIFSKLFRADNAMETETEGTGLGLYIVKSIVDQAGGQIWFNSEQNKGTEFYAAFPIAGMKAKQGSKKLD